MVSMKTFEIKNDDLTLKMISGDEETCQDVERALTTRLGEFFLNLEHGMDYSEFEKKAPDISWLKYAITEAALQDERIKNISDIKINIDNQNRKAAIKFTGKIKGGDNISGEVII